MSIELVFYNDLGMQDDLNDYAHSVKEVTDDLAGQLSHNTAAVLCSRSIKEADASSAAFLAAEDTTHKASRTLPAYRAMQDAGSWEEVNRVLPTRFAPPQRLRSRYNNFHVSLPNGACQGKVFESSNSSSVFLRMRKRCFGRICTLVFPALLWTRMQCGIRLLWEY